MPMTWEWTFVCVIVVGFYLVCMAVERVERQAKKCADSLEEMTATLEHVHDRLGAIETNTDSTSARVAPSDDNFDD
jgi:hypothetical protein